MQTLSKTSNLSKLERHCAELSAEWDASTDKKQLIQDIEDKALTQKTVFVDSALILGLGSLEFIPDIGFAVYGFEDKEAYLRDQNRIILRQLLVFETVLTCLRNKFAIKGVHLQDPNYTPTYIKFLERRGHKVVPYNFEGTKAKQAWLSNRQAGLDPGLRPLMSSSTMVFAPYLVLGILFELVYTCRPSLYFGTNLMDCTRYEKHPSAPQFYPADDFEDLVISYEDGLVVNALVQELAGAKVLSHSLVLSWPADTTNKDAMIRLQNRRLAMEKPKEERPRFLLNYTPDLDSDWATTESDSDSDSDSTESESSGSIESFSSNPTESKHSASTGMQSSRSTEPDPSDSRESTSEYSRLVEMLRKSCVELHQTQMAGPTSVMITGYNKQTGSMADLT